jgi:hypothetical protein
VSQVGKYSSLNLPIQFITGNAGGAVGPNGVGNIDLLGANPITVTGNPGLNTLTITVATATTAQIGVTTLATDAETIAGVVTDNAVVPSGLAAKLGVQTLFGVPYGNTTAGAIQWAAPGTDGQLLIASSAAAPAFGTLTSLDGTVNFAIGPNTLDLSAAAANVLQDQIYYIGKHGNDANTGRNIENAVLTFTQAIVLATAAVPSAVNRFSIVCLDDGIYAEAITVPQYVDVFAPSATLTGTIVVADDSSIKFSRLNVATATIGVSKIAGTVYTNVDIDYVTCAGTGIGFLGVAGFINCHWKELYVENGFGIGDLAAAMAHMHLFGGDIYITGTGTAVARANTGSTIGHIDHIADIGAGVGTGIAVFDGTVAINVNTVNNSVAYNVSGATSILRLFANSITGTRTVALGGTDNHWVPPVAMANGELVIGAGVGVDPVVASLTSAGGTITITPGAGSIDLDTAASIATSYLTDDANSAIPALGVLTVAGGANIATSSAVSTVTIAVDGTTDHTVQVGNATGSLTSLVAGTDGQVLLGDTGADPVFATLTSTDGSITFTPGAGTLDLQATTAGVMWSREAGAAVPIVVDHGYINTNVGLTTFTLPAIAAVGDEIEIVGESAAGWLIAQNAGQNIQFNSLSTTGGVGGSLASTNQYDTVHLVCRVANTTFHVTSSTGNLTIV